MERVSFLLSLFSDHKDIWDFFRFSRRLSFVALMETVLIFYLFINQLTFCLNFVFKDSDVVDFSFTFTTNCRDFTKTFLSLSSSRPIFLSILLNILNLFLFYDENIVCLFIVRILNLMNWRSISLATLALSNRLLLLSLNKWVQMSWLNCVGLFGLHFLTDALLH